MKWTFGARCVHIGTQFKQSFWICICFKCEILPYIRKKKCRSIILIRRCTIMLMKIKRPNIFFHGFYMDGNPRTLAPWRRKRTVICPRTAPGRRTRTQGRGPKNLCPKKPGLDYQDADIGDGLPTNRKTLGGRPQTIFISDLFLMLSLLQRIVIVYSSHIQHIVTYTNHPKHIPTYQ